MSDPWEEEEEPRKSFGGSDVSRRLEHLAAIALSHAQLRIAADMLQCVLNSKSSSVVPRDEVIATVAKIEDWIDLVWGIRAKVTRSGVAGAAQQGESDGDEG